MKIKKWSTEDIEFLKANYPDHGKQFCALHLGRGEGAIRWMASELKLKLNTESDFFKSFQKKAAESKVGKKRPDQSLVMKRLHAEGKLLKNEQQRAAISTRFKKWHSENEHPKGYFGKKHPESVRAVMGQKSKAFAKSLTKAERSEIVLKAKKTAWENGTYSHERKGVTWKASWQEIGGKRKYFRSKWESNYARYLEYLKQLGEIKEWQHEPKCFWFEGVKRGTVSYLPDFWVLENNGNEVFHEVKGWMDQRSRTKIRRMAKYHPEVKLIVIQAKQYNEIQNKLRKAIPGWE